MTSEIIQQQIDYYRNRATEYDEWFYRIGRYDRGEKLNQQWFVLLIFELLILITSCYW